MTDSRQLLRIILMVALIVTGEVSVVPQAAIPVAQVVLNRYPVWGWDGWYATAEEPADWALDAAWQAWWGCGDDEGNLYAISGADMEALGFDRDGWRNVGSSKWPLWIGREWK